MYKYFLVSYDLHRVRNYENIENGIIANSIDYTKPLESVFIIKTDGMKGVGAIKDSLKRYIDSDDSILVIECNIRIWATRNIDKDITDKMQSWS